MIDNKTPGIDQAIYDFVKPAADKYQEGNPEELTPVVYSALKAMADAGMNLFFAGSSNFGENSKVVSASFGQPTSIGQIAGHQFGMFLSAYNKDEAKEIIEAFIFGLQSNAPMIEATVDDIIQKTQKGS